MTTKRHHYIPEFYIKGFLNPNNKVYVFDKFERSFKPNDFSPKQIFYEWHRNTLEINGVKDDFIEKLYGYWDNKLSKTYERIINQEGKLNSDPIDYFNLITFISLIHWRIPFHDEMVVEQINKSSNQELYFKIINKNTNQEASPEFYEEVKKRAGFIEMMRLAKPVIEYLTLDIENSLPNWKIYYSGSATELHILGDNPIVFKTEPEKNILETELIFPLSKGKFMCHTNGKRLEQIQPEARVSIDVMLFLQAERYVIGPNKEYLKTIQMLSENYNTEARIDYLRNDIFKIFK
nr:DUF4238 domain-containing protein [uncultured Draconibacterium sp.]